MNSKKLNGFNNGIDTTDGIGGSEYPIVTIPSAKNILSLLIPQKDNVSNEENQNSIEQNIEVLKDWVKLHVQEALTTASEQAKTADFYVFGNSEDENRINDYDLTGLKCSIDKESILNAYPDNKIQ